MVSLSVAPFLLSKFDFYLCSLNLSFNFWRFFLNLSVFDVFYLNSSFLEAPSVVVLFEAFCTLNFSVVTRKSKFYCPFLLLMNS